MKTRLLIVLNGLEIGGAQNMAYELVRCIDRSLFDVSFLCYGKRIDNSLTRNIENIQEVKYLGLSGKITPKTMFHVLRAISAFHPDVVHSHLGGTVFAAPWGLLHRKPVIVTAHTKPEKAFSKTVLPFLKCGMRADIIHLVTVSKENQSLMMKFFDIDEDKCKYINNGINIDRYYKKDHKCFTFINVGRQDENKNQSAILRCFAEFHKQAPDSLLYLVGDGDRHTSLIHEAEELGVADVVLLPGSVGNTEDYYAVADCYIQASHREALPLTALEAMASGLPLISTNVGGMKDIVTEANGYLIADHDEGALFKAMVSLYDLNEEQRQLMGKTSYKMVRMYSADEMTRQYEKIYKANVKKG